MKKLILLIALLATAIVLPAQDTKKEPKKNVVNLYRVFPKPGQDAALRAAITAHVQKFHTAWKWRVYEVQTGPDSGSYQILEGPTSWTDFETRGDLGAEHMKDYTTNMEPLIEKTTPQQYMVYEEDVSTVAVSAFSTKALITRAVVKPGHGPALKESLKTWKKVWEKRGINVVVYQTYSSGAPAFSIVRRLKDGLKDLDADIMSTDKAFEAVGGAGAMAAANEEIARDVSEWYGEIIEFKPELSSR